MAETTTPKLHLIIITQDRQLVDQRVDSVTLPTAEGEITVLPNHIPLLSRLQTGELRYRTQQGESTIVISKGFVDMAPGNTMTVLVDSAVEAREISVEKAEAAIRAAQETMAKTEDQRELILAEASLRRALLEIKVAQKTKHSLA